MSATRLTIRDGIVVGLIGYATVAVFYSAFDVLAARDALHTVNMLGRAVFRGLRDPSILQFPLSRDPNAILAYNALHLFLALLIGLVVVSLVTLGDRSPERRRTVRVIIACGLVLTVLLVGVLTTPMRPVLPWWSIVAANALSTFFVATYLLSKRPALWSRWLPRSA
jgi:amino acid transporter